MLEIITYIALAILVLLGVSSIIHALRLHMLRPTGKKAYIVIPLSEDDKDAEVEMIIKSVKLQTEVGLGTCYGEILVVDCGMDSESREICEKGCAEYDVALCSIEEVDNLLLSAK